MEEQERQATPGNMEQTAEPAQEPTPKKKAKKGHLMGRILGGEILQSKKVQKQLPLVLLLCIFGLLLVRNRYQVEDLTKAKIASQERINALRESSIEQQKRYQESIKISEIAERLDSTGVGITAGPPFEI